MQTEAAGGPAEVDREHPLPSDQRRYDRLLVAGLVVVLACPLLVGVGALRRPTWYPVLDFSMTELRLRDVGTSHTPLVGLPGRIGTLANQGSHPGPLSFYALAPLYRLFGSSAWAMQAAAAALNVAALAASVWIALRRGGRRLAIAVGVLLALLSAGYGVSPLTEAWNPYLPMLWWVVVLLSCWSVLAGDRALYPVAIVAASFAAQTHMPYLALAGGLVVLVALWLLLLPVLAPRLHRLRERRANGEIGPSPAADEPARQANRWIVVGLILGVVLWVPPVIDHLSPPAGESSNAELILDSMLTPEEPPVGTRDAVAVALRHLDPRGFVVPGDGGIDGGDGALVEASFDADASVGLGLFTLAAWVAAAAWSARHRDDDPSRRSLWALHQVVGVALLLGMASISRIYGKVWYYLTLWAWGTTAVLLLAVGLTVAAMVGPGLDASRRRMLERLGAAGAAVVLTVVTVAFAVDARSAPTPDANLSETLGAVVGDTVAALEAGEGEAVGPDGRYLITWNDAFYFGSQGFGLVMELERNGIDARVEHTWRVPVTRHRVTSVADADATVALATGIYVEQWRDVPGAVEVAFVEPRDDAAMAEYLRLRDAVLAGLRAEGLDELVGQVDSNLFGASIDDRISEDLEAKMARMLLLGQETAVFVAPAGAHL